MNPSAARDRKILEDCCSGDGKATEDFVRRFSPLIYGAIKSALSAKKIPFVIQDLEDLHNSVFLALFEKNRKKLKQYQGLNNCAPATWLRVVTTRMALNYIRAHARKTGPFIDNRTWVEDIGAITGTEAESLELLINAEHKGLIQKALEKLSPKDRMVIRLHIENGYSLKEIAQAMDMSLENAYLIKHRAVKRLKTGLAGMETEKARENSVVRPGSDRSTKVRD